MLKTLLLPALVAGSLFAAGGAQALPLPAALAALAATAVPDIQVAPDVPVMPVAQGCGWGWHRGPWGGCRPNGWGPVYRPWGWGPHCWWRPGPFGPVRVCN